MARVVAVGEHDQPDRVGHLAEQRDLALQLRIGQQVVDRRELAARLVRVVADAGHSRLPRQGVVAVGIPRRVLLHRLEVLDVRDRGLVELLDPAELDQP